MVKTSPRYELRCQGCGWATDDDRHTVHCPSCGPNSLLRTVYADTAPTFSEPVSAFESYAAWLPYDLELPLDGLHTGLVRATELGERLGLSSLWLLVSGYAPDVGANLPACTFKTLEAIGVMSRVLQQTDKTLILSSAGNAGRAVLEIGSRLDIPAVVVVPEGAARSMKTTRAPGDRAPLLIALEGATYTDAIGLVGQVIDQFASVLVREGGAYNVARRDSMGVPVVRAINELGRIPHHYFQGVGSGTGGIAAHEAALRMAGTGRVPGGPMRLHLVQNAPFQPMVDAWRAGKPRTDPMTPEHALALLRHTFSSVLANATPPYHPAGGVRDVLVESGGEMLAVTSDAARAAAAALDAAHALDVSAEGGVAFAGLQAAVAAGTVRPDETVLVHLTGAGWNRVGEATPLHPYPVGLSAPVSDVNAVFRCVEQYLAGLD